MDLRLSPEEQSIADLAERVALDVLAPGAAEADHGHFPLLNMQALGTTGLLGVKIPKAFGGLAGNNVAAVHAIRALARSCPSTAVTVAVTNMVADMILRFGNTAQHQRFLPNLCNGEWLAGSFALSEPGAGSDAASLRTRAEKVDGGYKLNGEKLWITSGDVAGVILVMAKTDSAAGARGISAFLIEPHMAGFTVGRHEEKLGLLGSSTVSLAFSDVFVPDENRLGPEGIGFEIAMVALDGGRCGIGAQAVGMGEAALNVMAQAVEARKKSDRALGTDQGAQFRVADVATRLDAAWLLVLRAASMRDAGKKMAKEAAMAKVFATEAGNFACQQAVTMAQGGALGRHSPAARLLRDVRVSRIYEGTSEIQRLVIARHLASSVV
jgi:alkylation response protein AidB-like acyl-CoA dehydrogenase